MNRPFLCLIFVSLILFPSCSKNNEDHKHDDQQGLVSTFDYDIIKEAEENDISNKLSLDDIPTQDMKTIWGVWRNTLLNNYIKFDGDSRLKVEKASDVGIVNVRGQGFKIHQIEIHYHKFDNSLRELEVYEHSSVTRTDSPRWVIYIRFRYSREGQNYSKKHWTKQKKLFLKNNL